MYTLKTSAHFDSAHFLHGYEGKCRNIHGHRWVVEAEVCSSKLEEKGQTRGMVMDFGDLKRQLKSIADSLDHRLIYEKGSLAPATEAALSAEGFALRAVDFRPTAENLAEYIYSRLRETGCAVKKVAVYETPENCAIYEAEDNGYDL